MIIDQVNRAAIYIAAVQIVGPEAAQAIKDLYHIIDRAQHEAYQAGLAEGSAQTADAYDTGYLDGVTDTQVDPEYADEVVAEIVADAAEYAINGEYDASNVRDSGDEQP